MKFDCSLWKVCETACSLRKDLSHPLSHHHGINMDWSRFVSLTDTASWAQSMQHPKLLYLVSHLTTHRKAASSKDFEGLNIIWWSMHQCNSQTVNRVLLLQFAAAGTVEYLNQARLPMLNCWPHQCRHNTAPVCVAVMFFATMQDSEWKLKTQVRAVFCCTWLTVCLLRLFNTVLGNHALSAIPCAQHHTSTNRHYILQPRRSAVILHQWYDPGTDIKWSLNCVIRE